MRVLLAIAVLALTAHAAIAAQQGERSLRTANALLQRGLFDEAAAEYTIAVRALEDADERDEARYGLAVAQYRLGRGAEALDTLSDIETGGHFEFRADADVLRTHLLFGLKKYDEAADAAARAVTHDDHASWPETASLLVEARNRAGQHREAIAAYGRVAERLADASADSMRRASFFAGLSQSREARRPRDHARAADWFALAIERRARDQLSKLAMLQQAQSLRRAGNADEAIRAFEQAVARGGQQVAPDAMLGLGSLLRAEGRYDEASAVLRRLAEQHPRRHASRTQYELGLSLLESGEPSAAATALDAAARGADAKWADDIAYWRAKADLRRERSGDAATRLELAINRHFSSELIAEMRYDLGVALQRAGRDNDAANAFEAFRQSHPDHAMAPDALYAEASLALDRDDLETAAKFADLFAREHAEHDLAPRALFLLGEARYRQDAFELAAEAFEPLIDMEDDDLATRSRYRLGMSLQSLGRGDEAAEYLREVAGASAEYQPALFSIAEIEYANGDWEAAERSYDRYLDAVGRDGEAADAALMKLALARLRLDKYNDAIRSLGHLLETHPRSTHAPHALFELGQAHMASDNDADAIAAFNQLTAEHTDSRFTPHALRHLAALAARSGDASAAAQLYDRAARAGGDAFAEQLAVERARVLLDDNRPRDAAQLLEGARGEGRAWRVIALSRAGEHSAAIQAAEDADAEAFSEDVAALYWYDLATSLRETGADADAERIFAQLVGADFATSGHAAVQLADAYIDRDAFAEAADLLESQLDGRELSDSLCASATYKAAWSRYQTGDHRAVTRLLAQPSCDLGDLSGPAAMVLGESLLALKRAPQAAEQFTIALDSLTDRAQAESALLRLGEAHAAAQNWRESQRAYQRHLREYTKSPRWYLARFGVGWALENSGKPRVAITEYRKVADEHEGETAARAQFQIGECLFALGEHDEAVRELLKVDILHAAAKWSAAALYEAGRCFEAMGKVGEARAQYREVVERFGQSDWAKAARERLTAIAGPGGSRNPTRDGSRGG